MNGRLMPEPFSVICLSPQDWDTALPTNRQQIMLRAAQRGHHVLYVETGFFLGRHLWALLRHGERRSLASRLLSGEEVVPGVCVRKAFNVLPWRVRFRLPNTVNCAVTARLLTTVGDRIAAAGRTLDLRPGLGSHDRRVRRGAGRLRLRRRLHRADDLRSRKSDLAER